jgi:hypothetical protein
MKPEVTTVPAGIGVSIAMKALDVRQPGSSSVDHQLIFSVELQVVS